MNVNCLEASPSPKNLRVHVLAGGVPVSAVDLLQRAGLLNRGAIDISCVLAKLAEEVRTLVPERSEDDNGARSKTPGVSPGKRQLCFSFDDMVGAFEQVLIVDVNGTATDMNVQLERDASSTPDDADTLNRNVVIAVGARVSRLKAGVDRRESQATHSSSPRVRQPLIVTA